MDETRLLKERQELLDAQTALLQAAENEGRDLTEEEQKTYDERKTKVVDLDKRLKRLREVNEQQSAEPQRGAADDGGEPPAERKTAPPQPKSNNQGHRQYSLLRAIRRRAAGLPVDGLEGEVSQELAKRWGKEPQGFFMPYDLADPFEQRNLWLPTAERRDLTTTAGSGAVATIVDAANFIEILRNRMVVQALGATTLTGLVGDLQIPKQTGAATAYWIDNESGDLTESAQAIGQVDLSPKTVGAYTEITRKFAKQTSIDAEAFVRNDLGRVLALEIDRACINGSGSGAEPEGVLQDSNIPTVALGTDGDVPDWDMIVQLETEIAQDNADVGRLAYVTNAKARGKCKRTVKVSSTDSVMLWDTRAGDTPVNGYRCAVTNQVPSNLTKGTGENLSAMIFGNWESLVIGMWSGVDVIVNPFALDIRGGLRITMLQDLDIDFRHDEGFAKCVDIVTI